MNSDEELPILEDTTLIERINKNDLEPLYKNDHLHEYTKDEEETDDYYAEHCLHCPVGRLVAKR